MIKEECISREAFLDAFWKLDVELRPSAIDAIINMVNSLPPVIPKQRWIPVSESLPEEMGIYFVTLKYKEHGTGVTTLWFYNRKVGWDVSVADIVTAWMPLPEPYKEGENE